VDGLGEEVGLEEDCVNILEGMKGGHVDLKVGRWRSFEPVESPMTLDREGLLCRDCSESAFK